MQAEILRKLGLSDGEIKVYNTLLTKGKSTINNIHESVGIERRNIYDILNKLIEKGIITYVTENKHRLFQITHPSKIIGYIEEKERSWEDLKEDVKKEMPMLLASYAFKKPPIDATVFRGSEGVKAVWEDMLSADLVYWIGSGRYTPKKYPEWFAGWNRRRIEKKCKWVNLMRSEMREEIREPLKLETIRFLPKEWSGNPTVMGIFGNKIANIVYGDSDFAFVIESEELADNYRRYHRYLWENVAKA
ncbi:hypothetical protein HZB02_06425 [Candidatus Woesearchaeota archaeon]|nr:hypothetical protein [Candidatus Woesearchaeota archaeon]